MASEIEVCTEQVKTLIRSKGKDWASYEDLSLNLAAT